MLSMGLLPIFRQKYIGKGTHLRVRLQIVGLHVFYSHLCCFKLPKISSFLYIHSYINDCQINWVRTREKFPPENKHTNLMSFYEVEPPCSILNYTLLLL